MWKKNAHSNTSCILVGLSDMQVISKWNINICLYGYKCWKGKIERGIVIIEKHSAEMFNISARKPRERNI